MSFWEAYLDLEMLGVDGDEVSLADGQTTIDPRLLQVYDPRTTPLVVDRPPDVTSQRRHDLGASSSRFTSATSRSGLTTTPPEILLHIFKMVISWGGRHSRSCLLLVCCRWYHIMTGDPFIWNHIKIRYGNGTDTRRIASLANHARAALFRTGTVPLYVTFDFSAWTETYDDEPSGSDTDNRSTSSESDVNCPLQCTQEAVYVLRGMGDHVASRWKSLRILLPHHSIGCPDSVLIMFNGLRAPKLTKLFIERTDSSRMEIQSIYPIFKQLPRLQSLSTDLDLSRLELEPNSLVTLRFSMDEQWVSTLDLRKQLRLNWLHVHNPCWHDFGWNLYFDMKVSFLELETLVISGAFPDQFCEAFAFPVLRTLFIDDYSFDIIGCNDSFHASVQEIVWETAVLASWGQLELERHRAWFLEQSNTLRECTFPSLKEITLPKLCVPIAYPSLTATVQAFRGVPEFGLLRVVFEDGRMHLEVPDFEC